MTAVTEKRDSLTFPSLFLSFSCLMYVSRISITILSNIGVDSFIFFKLLEALLVFLHLLVLAVGLSYLVIVVFSLLCEFIIIPVLLS